MATRKRAAAKPKPTTKEPEGSVSALPDGIDRPVDDGGSGAVSAVPDAPGENTEH